METHGSIRCKSASVFFPEDLLRTCNGWLLGWWTKDPHLLVYVLAVLHSSDPSNNKNLSDRCIAPEGQIGFMPAVLGKFENSDICKNVTNTESAVLSLKENSPLYLCVRIVNHKIQLWEFVFQKIPLDIQECCKIFQYETKSLLSSELLASKINKNLKELIFIKEKFNNFNCMEKLFTVMHQWKQFRFFEVSEISDTLKATRISSGIHLHEKVSEDERHLVPYLKKILWKILFCSAFVRQLYQRFHQLNYVMKRNETEEGFQKCLRCQNVILSIVLDIILGIIVLHQILECFSPVQLLEFFMISANFVVDHLQMLLHWLMGVPAGLKLNYPLNSALGQFFLYHIYLWKTYITVVKPLLQYMLEAITLLGWLGLSFQMSLFSDLMSLATFHVYCFYVYAARLYHLHLSGLLSLWRLVRGRKWNPLRHRVDSCLYTTDQLYLGTISFMILLFLMLTTFLYYCVFSCLRLSSLAVLGILNYVIHLLNTAPFYAIVLFTLHSNRIAGEVNFTVVSNDEHDQPVIFMLKNSSSCFRKMWNLTQPIDFVPKDNISWGKLIKYLFLGKLIFPF